MLRKQQENNEQAIYSRAEYRAHYAGRVLQTRYRRCNTRSAGQPQPARGFGAAHHEYLSIRNRQAFRLTPHGLTFAKPATIAFQYDEQDKLGTAAEALRIAYQTENGIWKSPILRPLDTTARTLSVQITHFSDWTFFKNITLTPISDGVNPGGAVNLNVYQHIDESGKEKPGDELIVPPTPTPISEKYIKKWTVLSEGTLAHTQSKATYYAPRKSHLKTRLR